MIRISDSLCREVLQKINVKTILNFGFAPYKGCVSVVFLEGHPDNENAVTTCYA